MRLMVSQHYEKMLFGSELSRMEADLPEPLMTEESSGNFLG